MPVLTTHILVRPVSAVLLAIAEEIFLNAGAVTAGQMAGLWIETFNMTIGFTIRTRGTAHVE